MDLQYISDADGKQTAVIIPIEDWKDLTLKHEVLRDFEQKSQKTGNDGVSEKKVGIRNLGSLRKLGEATGKTFSIPDDFNDPLDDLKDYM